MVTDCVLGLSAQSFSDRPTPVMANIKALFEQTLYISLSFAAMALIPSLRRVKKWRFIPKHVERFFVDFMGAAIEARKGQVAAGQLASRVDFLDYIQQLAKKKSLSTREVSACSMTFLLDGFETTATILAHTLLLLGRDAKVQQRLRDELREHLNDEGFIDFDKLLELPYLNACVHGEYTWEWKHSSSYNNSRSGLQNAFVSSRHLLSLTRSAPSPLSCPIRAGPASRWKRAPLSWCRTPATCSMRTSSPMPKSFSRNASWTPVPSRPTAIKAHSWASAMVHASA